MKERDDAVSPVIGVMLMLVVTIIIAAVVSTFAGGIMTSQEPTPSASFDVSMTNESIELVVQSTSQDISSKDITIVLSNAGQTRKLVPGASTVPFGFNIVEWSEVKGFHDSNSVGDANIKSTQAANDNNSKQWFGNYTLKAGSRMSASGAAFKGGLEGLAPPPEGLENLNSLGKGDFLGVITLDQWMSIFGDDGGVSTTEPDPMTDNVLKVGSRQKINDLDLIAFLETKGVQFTNGKPTGSFYATAEDTNWSFGRMCTYGDGFGSISVTPGDRVSVTIVYTPSGQTMFMKTVAVKEA
ncbi:MAG: type IV pilin N-terminal domain-containing protein [Methanoculleus sp.]|nr:type IV pilin N-terminal domain-containing protein [Methanoculleus sp.]